MKLVFKILLSIIATLVCLYYLSFFLMPSVTVINGAEMTFEEAVVKLPNSGLDFGSLNHGDKNTLHYSWTQHDGEYRYLFLYGDTTSIAGTCGYVTNNEIHKRVVITVHADHSVTCK